MIQYKWKFVHGPLVSCILSAVMWVIEASSGVIGARFFSLMWLKILNIIEITRHLLWLTLYFALSCIIVHFFRRTKVSWQFCLQYRVYRTLCWKGYGVETQFGVSLLKLALVIIAHGHTGRSHCSRCWYTLLPLVFLYKVIYQFLSSLSQILPYE